MPTQTPRFGTVTKTTNKNGLKTIRTTKYHDFEVTDDEELHEARVPIIKITDASTVFEQMHLEHALTNYGAWVEKNPVSGKMYVVKCWLEKIV